MRVNVVMYFVFIYENRRMKLVEIVPVLGVGRGDKRENNGGGKSELYCKHIVNTTIYCPA
jgi:hypothetical protein